MTSILIKGMKNPKRTVYVTPLHKQEHCSFGTDNRPFKGSYPDLPNLRNDAKQSSPEMPTSTPRMWQP